MSMMCGASLGSVLVGSEFTVRGRARRKEAERAMVHGWLVARAKGGGYLWLARQSCSGGLEALLLIQGGVHWDLETSIFWHGVHWGLMTSGMFYDGVQGGRKIPTGKISFRFGEAFVGVRRRWVCFSRAPKAVGRYPERRWLLVLH